MKKHILCLGDSNTHGYCADPADCADGGTRFNESERWTKLLQGMLGKQHPNILVIAPPPIKMGMLNSPVAGTMGNGCVEKSEALAKEYQAICELSGVHFLDAGQIGCEFNQIDYMHLTRKGHASLANVLGELVPKLV